MNILTIIGSSRPEGNTEFLTNIALKDIPHNKIYLKDLTIQPIEDLRHTTQGFQPIEDDHDYIIEEILKHDILVFSTPIYWYSMSGLMKNFIDRFSQAIRDKRYPNLKEHLKNVESYVITVGGDNPRIKGLPLIQQFNYTFEFLDMPFSGYIIGQASRPGEIINDDRAINEAQKLNQIFRKKSTSNGFN